MKRPPALRPERCAVYASAADVPEGTKKIDALESALHELFFIEHSHLHKNDPAARRKLHDFLAGASRTGVWAYYPWLDTAVRIPSEDVYFRLRTARNRNLITDEEQRLYRAAVVGIAGLSVGSAVVSALVATGGPKRMKLADPDTVEITNLNRMRARLRDVGANKTDVAAREVWELDPFAELYLSRTGLSANTLDEFLSAEPRLDVFVDEMDAIGLKVQSRMLCRKRRIPVVMATDNGDGVIVDVERFDLEPKRPIFHGRVRISESALRNTSRKGFLALSSAIIDPAFFTERQQESILEVGKTLSGIPQLGTAAGIAGAAVAYTVRTIASGGNLPSGRYVIACEEALIPGYESAKQKEVRAEKTKAFAAALRASTKGR